MPTALFLPVLTLNPEDFEYQGEASGGRYLWVDRLSPRFRLKATDSNPWGKPWKLMPMADRGSNRGQPDNRLLRRVTFALFPLQEGEEAIPVRLDREIDAGPLLDTWAMTARVWAVMLAPTPPDNQLIYSIKPVDPFHGSGQYLENLHEHMEGAL